MDLVGHVARKKKKKKVPRIPQLSAYAKYIGNSTFRRKIDLALGRDSHSSVNPVSSTTHTQPPLHNASEPSFPCGTWPGLSVGVDIQDSSRAVRALPRHQVLHSGRGHPASFATPKTETWIFPPRLYSRNDTSMSLSPAACEASAMLSNQTDVSKACLVMLKIPVNKRP